MQSGAYIQIKGTVTHDIEFKQTLGGKLFGLFRVKVSKGIGFDEENNQLIHGERRYSAFIWSKSLFDQAQLVLKKGREVKLSGELDYIPVKLLPSKTFIANAPVDGLLLIINITNISEYIGNPRVGLSSHSRPNCLPQNEYCSMGNNRKRVSQ